MSESESGNQSRGAYRRILLKLSGEALGGAGGTGIAPEVLDRLTQEVGALVASGTQVALVLGGGNIFRGAGLQAAGMDRVTGDQIGMLATVINALAMADALKRAGTPAVVLSAIALRGVADPFDRNHAISHLEAGHVVLCSAGTGNPLFTTDSAACLRAIEIGAELVVKATKVDGVYSADPMVYPDATRFARLTFDEVLDRRLGVMDLTAICLARDHGLPLRVCSIEESGALGRLARGEEVGTLIEN